MNTHDMDIESLASLLEHPGWRLFVEHVQREWGSGGQAYAMELDKALDLVNDAAAASHARQIRAAQRVIERLIRWPSEELQRLRGREQQRDQTISRRGGL